MKRDWIFTFSLLAIAVVITGAIVRNGRAVVRSQSQSDTDFAAQNATPFEALNQKARAAKGGNSNSVHVLADEALNATAAFPEIPSTTVEAMKDRLVRAEMEYRGGKGKQKGIEEKDIARMVNQLADTLNLPNYVKTCPLQVRHLRMSLLLYMPNFIAQEHFSERPGEKRKVGLKITSKMSPLEAAYVALLMLEQKKDNSDFQVTSEEWRTLVHQKQMELWQAHREGRSLETHAGPKLSVQSGHSNPKQDEVTKAAAQGIAALPASALRNLPDTLLDTLGVIR